MIQQLYKLSCLLHKSGHSLMELVFPGICAVCHKQIEDSADVLCASCWAGLQQSMVSQYCPICGHDVGLYTLINGKCHRCQHKRPVIEKVIRTGRYCDILRELILQFKFQGKSYLDVFLGNLLGNAISGTDSSTWNDIDYLVPIPLHWRRYWHRRYNQSELLARATANYIRQQGFAIHINTDLVRIRYTTPQASLTRNKRLGNLVGAFALRRGHPFKNSHICLIDDITTTGTTLLTAARTIKKAGARKISAAVIAVAPDENYTQQKKR